MSLIPIYPKTQALIFDLDGTLADTMPIHLEAWKKTGELEGFTFTDERFWATAGVPSFKILKDLNKEFSLHMDPWGVTEKKEDIFLELLDKVQPIQPVVGLVHAYHGKLPMAVGTGGIIKIATFLLETLNIDSFFEILVTSEDVTHYKPHPETFLKCAEHMGIAPEFCQVFEDGDPGIEAAKAGGMQVTDVREYV